MSCERNSTRVAATAAVKSGVNGTAAKAGTVLGAVVSRTGQTGRSGLNRLAAIADTVDNQLARCVAPASNALLRAVDRPAVVAAKAVPYVVAALATLRFRGYLVTGQGSSPVAAIAVTPRSLGEMAQNRRTLGRVKQGLAMAGTVSGLAGSAVAAATAEKSDHRTLELRHKNKVVASATFQKAPRLSQVLNRLDLVGSHRLGQNVISSEGDIVRVGRGSWHRGTSIINTPQGRRTITHVQSLSLPAQHYYFDRRLSAEETAGMVSGRMPANRLPGYVGEVHRLENLLPSWGAAKKALITTRLYHPPSPAQWGPKQEEKKE